MGEKNELISIIVPVYNTSKYLRQCMESIISQTYKNIEIIIVNDGSTDNSLEICNEYKEKDSRIKVFSKENGGLSSTRNYGLDCCTGKYFTFVDSDDFIGKNMIENLYSAVKKYDVPVGVENINISKLNLESDVILNKSDIIKNLFFENYFWTVMHSKLIKTSIIGKTRFRTDMKISEDMEFLYHVLNKVDKMVVIPPKEYIYRIVEGSLTHSNFKYEIWNKEFEFLESLIQKGTDFRIALISRYCRINSNLIINYDLAKCDLRKIRCNIKKYLKELLKSSEVTKKEKLKVCIIYNLYWLKPLIVKIKNF